MPREIKQKLSFKQEGTFQSLYAAEAWCIQNGYEYGSLCCQQPIAIVKGDYNLPQKWKNFSKTQKNQVDGVITSFDFREGEVTVTIYN